MFHLVSIHCFPNYHPDVEMAITLKLQHIALLQSFLDLENKLDQLKNYFLQNLFISNKYVEHKLGLYIILINNV